MDTYYALLGIPTGATTDEIAEAYRRQRERYSAERVAGLDADFKRIASERTHELERAFTVLSDPQRRHSYDQSIGIVAPQPKAGASQPGKRVSRREIIMAIGGAVVGLFIITTVWILAGRSTQPAGPPVAAVNRPAPTFTLSSLSGQPVNLSDYRGKVVMLNFWWSGCEPCREETPALQAAYQKLVDQGLVIVGVNVRGNERSGPNGISDVKNFVDTYKVTYPIVLDEQGEVDRNYQIYVLPTTVFIDQNGIERFRSFSAVNTDDVEHVFKDLQRQTTALR